MSFFFSLSPFPIIIQPVYKDPEETMRECRIPKSQSCPNLFMDDDDDESMEARIIPNIKFRERAFSECIKPRQKKNRSISTMTLNRVQSDSNLSQIDKEKTFASDAQRSGNVMPGELLAKLVVALGGYRIADTDEQKQASIHSSALGVHGFSDSQILASERNFDSNWSIAASDRSYVTPPYKPRLRARSEIRIPIEQSVKVANLKYDQGLEEKPSSDSQAHFFFYETFTTLRQGVLKNVLAAT